MAKGVRGSSSGLRALYFVDVVALVPIGYIPLCCNMVEVLIFSRQAKVSVMVRKSSFDRNRLQRSPSVCSEVPQPHTKSNTITGPPFDGVPPSDNGIMHP